MTLPTVSTLSTAPSTASPDTFATRADTLFGTSLPTFVTQVNALATAMNLLTTENLSDYGLGATGVLITDLTATLTPRLYRFVGSTATGSPDGAAYQYTLLVHGASPGQTAMAARVSGSSANQKIWHGSRGGTSGSWIWQEVNLSSSVARPATITISDDAVGTYTPPSTGGWAVMAAAAKTSAPSTSIYAMFHYDVGSSPALSIRDQPGSSVESTTGTMTGTTGTDAKVTISARDDGTIQIENRSGSSLPVRLYYLGDGA